MNNRSDLWLERVALGELEADLTPQEQAKVDEIRESNEAILARYPAQGVRIEIERRARDVKPPRSAWSAFTLVAAGAAVAGVLFVAAPEFGTGLEATRLKGNSRLIIHKKTANGVTQLSDGSAVGAGDLLQVGYTPGDGGSAMIASLDGRGSVTVHWPETKSGWSMPLDTRGASIPSAYELDDAPQFERFYLVRCPNRFRVGQVIEQIASTGAPVAGEACTVDILSLRKKTP